MSLVALTLAVAPALGQEQEQPKDPARFAGVYEFEAPDYGVIAVVVELNEEGGLLLTAMQSTLPLKHLSGNTYELNNPDFGIINIGFLEEEDGTVTSMSIDAYDFSFVAVKKIQ